MPDPNSNDWIPVTAQVKPPASDGDWIPVTQQALPYTGEILPFRRDESGLHLAVPGIISNAITLMQKGGQAATGQGPMPTAQEAVGMAAFGASPFGGRIPSAEAMGVRPASAPAPAAARLADFQGQGITPSVPAISQGRATGLAAQAARNLPFSPVQRGIRTNIGETEAAAGRAARQFGTPATDTFATGSITRDALRRFASDSRGTASDFNKFYEAMGNDAPPVAIPNTLKILGELNRAYPNAPGLTEIFTSPPILRMARELEPRQVKIPAQASSILDPYGRPIITRSAQTVQQGGKLSIEELRGIKGQIGEKLEAPTIGPDSIPRGQLKRLQGALIQDEMAAAAARSPAALRELTIAKRNYQIRMGLIDRLDRLTSKEAPESIYYDLDRAATEGPSADSGLLVAVKRVTTPREWGDIGASVIQRLGNPKPGVARAPGEPDFSVGTFATNWRKMSPRAKDLLFGKDEPGKPRAGLEQLSRVASAMQNVATLANRSHTADIAMTATIVEEVTRALLAGTVPVAALAGFTGGYGVSRLLMSPAFTRWLYRLPSVVNSAPPLMARSIAVTALASELAPRKSQQSEEQPSRLRTARQLSPRASQTPALSQPSQPSDPLRASVVGP